MRFPARAYNSSAGVTARHTETLRHEWLCELCNTVVLARQPPLMAVCWEQEQPDGKVVTSSTSEVVSQITLNPEVMQIPPAPEESGYQNVAALVGLSANRTEAAVHPIVPDHSLWRVIRVVPLFMLDGKGTLP
jgi:hypothetical protein